jgi:hypothetical protein
MTLAAVAQALADAWAVGLHLIHYGFCRMHQHAVPANLPSTPTVVHLVLTGTGSAERWLDIERPTVTVCKDDQGLDVDLAVEATPASRWPSARRAPVPPNRPTRSRIAANPWPVPAVGAVEVALAEILIGSGQVACSYSWRTPPSRWSAWPDGSG